MEPYQLILTLSAGLFSFFATTLSFLFGIIVATANSILVRRDEMMTMSHMFHIVVTPLLYLIIGVMFHSFVSIIFEFAIINNETHLLQTFVTFTQNQIDASSTLSGLMRQFQVFLANLIPLLRDWFLNITIIVYLFIPIFYISQSIKILEITNLMTSNHANTSIFGILFYAAMSSIAGIVIATVFASIVDHAYFKNHPTIPQLGTITSINDYTTAKLKQWVQRGVGSTNNNNNNLF